MDKILQQCVLGHIRLRNTKDGKIAFAPRCHAGNGTLRKTFSKFPSGSQRRSRCGKAALR